MRHRIVRPVLGFRSGAANPLSCHRSGNPQGAQALTDRVDMVPQLPTVDLTHGVERYFEFVQKTVDAQREIATLWVELLTSLSGTIREQTEKVSHLVAEQADRIGDLVAGQAAEAEQVANE